MTATTIRPAGMTPAGTTPAPTVSGGPVVAAQLIACPTCGRQVASLLAGCDRPACRRLELDHDAALTRATDR